MEPEINLNIGNSDGSFHLLERKKCVKYLGVMIDKSLTWNIAFICSRISRNIGIISKLRHYLSIQQLKQLYYNLIYPYMSYIILALGSVYKTHMNFPLLFQAPFQVISRSCFRLTPAAPTIEHSVLHGCPDWPVISIYTLRCLLSTIHARGSIQFIHLFGLRPPPPSPSLPFTTGLSLRL